MNAFSLLTISAVLTSALSLAGTARADAAIPDLAKASGCTSCHAVDEKIVGPAFKKVAEKYAADKDAVDSISQSIRNGSSGKWGRIPMPAHNSLSPEDIKTLATWVMGLK